MDAQTITPALILNLRSGLMLLEEVLTHPHSPKKELLLRRASIYLSRVEYAANCIMEWTLPSKAWNSNGKDDSFKFAAITLSEHDKEDFTAFCAELKPDTEKLISELAFEGYKMSLSADLENQCFLVSHTNRDPSHPHYNTTCTSRSDDWTEALNLNVYKLRRLFPNKPLPTQRKKDNWG